jgi:hypothetical protein
VALWREALLAQAVLRGQTSGYTKHPQLLRFREAQNPVQAIAQYLQTVNEEAIQRGYNFDPGRIGRYEIEMDRIPVTRGQMLYEWQHLRKKLTQRAPQWLAMIDSRRGMEPNSVFRVVRGPVEKWEKIPG